MTRGRRIQFTLDELKQRIDDYFKYCDENEEPYTVSELALFLDVDRSTLLRWEKEEIQFIDMSDDEIVEFCNTIKRAKYRVEAFAEKQLFKAKNPAGTIFNLKNNFGWIDKQEIESRVEKVDTRPLKNLSKEELLQLAAAETTGNTTEK